MEAKQGDRIQHQVASAVEQVGAKITEFFSGNPLETDVGKMIAVATNAETVQQEDWGLIMTICDYIIGVPNGARDAIRAIKKQLADNITKSPQTIMYTLVVLEAAVKNCGLGFASQVCKTDFLDELIKVVKKETPPQVQEKILGLIQSWADAFRNVPECAEVAAKYDELKRKGIEFPATDLDSFTPIITPRKTVFPDPEPQEVGRNSQPGMYIASSQTQPVVDDTVIAKLQVEIAHAKKHAQSFLELMTQLPPILDITDQDLRQKLQKIYESTKEMRNRTAVLVQQIFENQDLVTDLLDTNDILTNAINLYENAMNPKEPEPRIIDSSAPGPSTARSVVAPSAADSSLAFDQTDAGLNVAAFNKTEPITDRVAQDLEDWLKIEKKHEEDKPKDDGL